jgi:hypothetical protein
MGSYRNSVSIQSFSVVDSHSLKAQLTARIKSEIEGNTKEYILKVEEQEYIKYLIDKYTLEQLKIDFSSEYIPEPVTTKEWIKNRIYGGQYQAEVYSFTIYYNYSGSGVLFKVRPDEFRMSSRLITLNESEMKVSFTFKLDHKNPEIFNQTKNDYRDQAFMNLKNTNLVADSWNNSLIGIVTSSFKAHKDKFLSENVFFTAINVKVDKSTDGVFTAPTIKKKIIPQPSGLKTKEFSSSPSMANEMYDDILKIIYQLGKSMERKPSTYIDKDEEGLRDQILLFLETRYDSTTATGETFNRSGENRYYFKICSRWH